MRGEGARWDNHLGVYAFKERSGISSLGMSSAHVVGEVELWGEIVEHEIGYRAEYARIRSLDLPHLRSGENPHKAHRLLASLRKSYGVAA